MIMMPRDRALTILTNNQLKTKWGHEFKSPCLRALNLYDGVKVIYSLLMRDKQNPIIHSPIYIYINTL